MKILIAPLLFAFTFITGCTDSSVTLPELQNSLSENKKETLTKSWEDATYVDGNY